MAPCLPSLRKFRSWGMFMVLCMFLMNLSRERDVCHPCANAARDETLVGHSFITLMRDLPKRNSCEFTFSRYCLQAAKRVVKALRWTAEFYTRSTRWECHPCATAKHFSNGKGDDLPFQGMSGLDFPHSSG